MNQIESFKVAVNLITTYGVDPKILGLLGAATTDIAKEQNFSCEISGVGLFPIITDVNFFSRKDFYRYDKKDKICFIGKNIDFEAWTRSRKRKRLNLAIENFKESFLDIPDRHLTADSKSKLIFFLYDGARRVASDLNIPSPNFEN